MQKTTTPGTIVDGAVEQLRRPIEFYQQWRYKNIGLLIASVIAFWLLLRTPALADLFLSIGGLGYIGAFIAGLLSVSVFTLAPAAVILFDIAVVLDPLYVALVAAAGAALGDYLVLRAVSSSLFDELEPLFKLFGGSLLRAFTRSPYFQWLLPFIGAFIIAMPALPDEFGVSILGLAKLPRWRFLLIAFLLNAVGIFALAAAAAR